MKFRKERDALGEVLVPEGVYWGPQTQRSHMNFPQNTELMPLAQIYALAMIKKAAAVCNFREGKLDDQRRQRIVQAADEILDGRWDDQFPLVVWQTGSGTQTNMNVNEVIANRGNELAGKKLLHPNDHVNMSQSSNDTFPSAMHLSTALAYHRELLPAIKTMEERLAFLSHRFMGVIKTGRTHLQDATPICLGSEISAWLQMLREDEKRLEEAVSHLYELAIGGTAVGTGLNAPGDFGERMAEELGKMTGLPLTSMPNKFFGLSSQSPMANFHGAMKVLAMDLYKIASDIRFLSCGPRSGIGELRIPANEPGSSIMPGKVNPTQVESLCMICMQVLGNDVTVSMAASQGQMQLNVNMPVILLNVMQSLTLLAKGMTGFTEKLLKGLEANESVLDRHLKRSLMLVTALAPKIGYDQASKIAKNAYAKNESLKESALELALLTEEEFDRLVDPEKMV